MKFIHLAGSFAIILSVLHSPAVAEPILTVEPPTPTVFRPFQPLPDGEVMTIRMSVPDGVEFNGELEITPTDAVEFQWNCGRTINALLTDNELRPEAGRYVGLVSIPPRGERVYMLRWRPEDRAFVEPGRCDLFVDVSLLDQSGLIVAEQTEVQVGLQVLTDTTLSIGGTSGTVSADRTFAFIDFGELETGERAFIIFNVQSNADVDFSIESENNGALVSQDEDAHRIEYSATFDGVPLALATGDVVRRRPEPSLQGSSYRLDVQVGDAEGAYAGQYQDNLTVIMTAR